AASIRSPSCSTARAAGTPRLRGASGISLSSRETGGRKRRAYSAYPSSTQRGWRAETVNSTNRTIRSLAGAAWADLRAPTPCLRPGARPSSDPRAFVARGEVPQAFDVVELPDLGQHHVDDRVGKIDEHPLAGFLPLDAERI